MKRLTALVMAAVMVLSLVGCGGSGGEVPLGGNCWGTTDDRAICNRAQVVTFLYRTFS